MDIFSVLSLFGGLAMFLYGMRLMGNSLKESSSGTLKNIMSGMTNSPLKAFLLGCFVTALIQSSNATIVITSGLVAAEIITLRQSLGIIIGANVGTTITGQIIRLMDINSSSTAWLQFFKPSTLAPIALIIGIILIMFCKFNNSRLAGNIIMGFGILFTGLLAMTDSVTGMSDTGVFNNLFTGFGSNPFLGCLVGAVVAFILQSASATIGILQSFSMTGLLTFGGVYSIIVGVFLGVCVTTAIVCSIGAKPNARRVGIVNIIFNLCKAVLVFIGVFIAHQLGLLNSIWDAPISSGGIANANTIFNLICAIILLPFIGTFERLSYKIVKDEPVKANKYDAKFKALDPVFFSTPAIAFNSCYDALLTMAESSMANIRLGLQLLHKFDQKTFDYIQEEEKNIDKFADRISNYLVQLSAKIREDNHIKLMDEYHKVIAEFERLGDHAVNLAEEAEEIHSKNTVLSEFALSQIDVTAEILDKIMDYSKLAFEKRDAEAAKHIEPLEEVVDDLVYAMKESHLVRLRNGKCNIEVDNNYLNILNNLERISDVCSNVGIAVVARVKPELANEAHKYISRLHQGKDEAFNKEYQEAHDYYFDKLETE
ncbi:MAG: Na/Pi cotransporter family protein [Lachnospiraceae bacterium]|nr:Na/Pi cotransporter family protein [Lachnospiraceae bacterium]